MDNNSVIEETKKMDRLWNLRPWIPSLQGNFVEVSPEGFNTVDEVMVPFKEKSIFRQYMPKKSHKWGIKI